MSKTEFIREDFIFKYIKDKGSPLTLNDIANMIPNKTWHANIYNKKSGLETIVAYASFNSTNLMAMYGDRLVKSFELLENGDFEIHLQEEE